MENKPLRIPEKLVWIKVSEIFGDRSVGRVDVLLKRNIATRLISKLSNDVGPSVTRRVMRDMA